jgi:biotin synthase
MTQSYSTELPVNSRTRQEFLLRWLEEEQDEAIELLSQSANEVRERFIGSAVNLWGTVKISNYCDEDCEFCGLRTSVKSIERYRLSAEDILASANAAAAAGCCRIILQSGCDRGVSADWISEIIRKICGETGLEMGLSLGERSESELAAWRRAGAESYSLRFITSNTTLYRHLHGRCCQDARSRLPLLSGIKQMGYKVGSGIIVGFPGQSTAGLVDDLELIRNLDLDIVLISPYIWPDELANNRYTFSNGGPNSAKAVLKVISLVRHLCPSAEIPSVSALATAGGMDIHAAALRRGANVLVMDCTPEFRREQYRCYPGRIALDEKTRIGELRTLLERHPVVEENISCSADATSPKSPRIRVGICMGSSCFCRGNNHTVVAIKTFIAGQQLSDHVTLEGHLCQGQCNHGPNILIDGKPHQQANTIEVLKLLCQKLKNRK